MITTRRNIVGPAWVLTTIIAMAIGIEIIDGPLAIGIEMMAGARAKVTTTSPIMAPGLEIIDGIIPIGTSNIQ
jgi:hypothetical protein